MSFEPCWDYMKKLILFGDSNTYGYDPRGFLGGRYPDLKPYHECSVEMNSRFMSIAEHYNIPAFDAGTWNISMGSDGVHFSVEGHKLFAQKFLESFLQNL